MVCPRGSGEWTPIPRARTADQRSTRNRIPRQGELLRRPLPRTPLNSDMNSDISKFEYSSTPFPQERSIGVTTQTWRGA